MNHGGKGSRQRPTNYMTFSEGMERIFGKRQKTTDTHLSSNVEKKSDIEHDKVKQENEIKEST